jgi:hypothetical protein
MIPIPNPLHSNQTLETLPIHYSKYPIEKYDFSMTIVARPRKKTKYPKIPRKFFSFFFLEYPEDLPTSTKMAQKPLRSISKNIVFYFSLEKF